MNHKIKITFHLTFLILIGLSILRCEEKFNMSRHFMIRKGEHYSTPRIVESLQSNRLVFQAQFDESAIYDLGSDPLQTNKNKLVGFSDCNSLHHQNSARFAWQWYNDRLEIYAYCYVDGERKEELVGIAELNKSYRYEIELTQVAYIFKFNNQQPVVIQRKSDCNTGLYYKLWPYFGGTIPAPHDIHIMVQTYY